MQSSTSLSTSALETLADLTTLSIDSGSIDTVARYAKTGLITDATTNPLFVSQAGSNGDARYEAMVMEAVAYAKAKTCSQDGCPVPDETLNLAVDRLAVNLGKELVGLVNGRVSTEVDIRLSYDTEASVERGKNFQLSTHLCQLYSDEANLIMIETWSILVQHDPLLQCMKKWVSLRTEYLSNLRAHGKAFKQLELWKKRASNATSH